MFEKNDGFQVVLRNMGVDIAYGSQPESKLAMTCWLNRLVKSKVLMLQCKRRWNPKRRFRFFNGYDVDKIWMHNDHNTIYIIHILYTKLIIYSICVAWARHVGSSPKKAIYNLRTAVVLMVKHIAILGIFKLDHQQLENNLKSKYGNIHHEEIRRIFNDYELSTCLDETTHVHLFDCKHLGLETLVLSMLTAHSWCLFNQLVCFPPVMIGRCNHGERSHISYLHHVTSSIVSNIYCRSHGIPKIINRKWVS